MSDLDIEARLCALAEEMEKLIAENFAKPPDEQVHKRLNEIRDEIQRHGWAVTWSAGINPENPTELTARVQLWKPKTGLSPEDQQIYDNWFKRMNNIKEGE